MTRSPRIRSRRRRSRRRSAATRRSPTTRVCSRSTRRSNGPTSTLAPFTLDDGTQAPLIMASPSIDEFNANYLTPGLFFTAVGPQHRSTRRLPRSHRQRASAPTPASRTTATPRTPADTRRSPIVEARPPSTSRWRRCRPTTRTRPSSSCNSSPMPTWRCSTRCSRRSSSHRAELSRLTRDVASLSVWSPTRPGSGPRISRSRGGPGSGRPTIRCAGGPRPPRSGCGG